MSERRNQKIVLSKRPDGEVRESDFRMEDAALPKIGEGEVLLETIYLSIDPYMRWWIREEKSYNDPINIGDVMVGGTVCRVIETRHTEWEIGDWVLAFSGWQKFSVSDGSNLRRLDGGHAPPSTALGVLGMTGFTAYAGLRNIGKPQPGETVVVAAASGAVGSAVGQIARIYGARAVGITTGTEKLSYVKEDLQFDAVVDYKASNFKEQLATACPSGIDVYFENVGGVIWDAVLPLLNTYARVPVCGLISQYQARSGENDEKDRLPYVMSEIMSKSLTIRGFIQTQYSDEQMPDYLCEAAGWIADDRLRYREHVVDGLENAPAALVTLMEGKNFGKTLVRVGQP